MPLANFQITPDDKRNEELAVLKQKLTRTNNLGWFLFILGLLLGTLITLIFNRTIILPMPDFEIGVWNAWIFMVWLLIQTVVIRLVSKEVYQKAGYHPDMKLSYAGKIANYISTPLWLLSTAYSIFLPFKLGTIWFYTGLVIFLLGLVINIIVTINFTMTPINEPITKGAYRYSRHPGYASLILIYFAVGMASASWIFLLVTIMWAVLLNISVKDEERYCLDKYGDAYRKYMNRTPRWIGTPKSTEN